MTDGQRPGSTLVEFPGDLEIRVSREFRAPIGLVFEGWPGVEAVETVELRETGLGTHLTRRLAFPDQAARDQRSRTDGITSNDEILDGYLTTLQSAESTGQEASA